MATPGAPGDTGHQDRPSDPADSRAQAPRVQAPRAQAPRAQAPIRWPRPDAPSLTLVGVWAIGVVVALFVPALIVPPNQKTAPAGSIWLAFSTTVVGAAVMLLASFGMWRRSRDSSVIVMGAVPAIACVAGGIILAATKFVA